MKYTSLIVLLISFVLSGCSATNSGSSLDDQIGEVAPLFTHTSLTGEEVSLIELRGKVVYIFFYGANCPHCRSNGPVTETQIHQQFESNPDFVALGLDTWNNSGSSNTSFRNITGITYPLLLNARQSLVNYYGNSGAYDRSVVIDAEGKIAYMGNGFVNTDVSNVVDVIERELANN